MSRGERKEVCECWQRWRFRHSDRRAACLFSFAQTVKSEASAEGGERGTPHKEKVSPGLCLRGVTGLQLGEGGPGGGQLTVSWPVSAEQQGCTRPAALTSVTAAHG